MMREIGGYIELDTYHLPMLHEASLALNCGRNALAYLLRARRIKRLFIPKFICDSVPNICEREGVPFVFYDIGEDFVPSQSVKLRDGEWFYFVNYYSRFDNDKISEYIDIYKRVIVDNAQSYFQEPVPYADTLYTCRKYFGVADGAFLYTDAVSDFDIPADESFERMHFILGRYERSASEFYGEYSANNAIFRNEPVKRMSGLTANLLHGIDYDLVKKVRMDNYNYLHSVLGAINGLALTDIPGTFMYPFMTDNGPELRKRLAEKKIYIPTLWPDVLKRCSEGAAEYKMTENILPLPIDQRYGKEDMRYMVTEIRKCII